MSEIPPMEWRTRSIPYHEMPSVKRSLLAGESRNSIAQDYGCSGRQVSKLIVQYLHLEGEDVIPGLTRKIRAERGRRARAQFLQWAQKRNEYEKAVVAEGRLKHARREAALALPPAQRITTETPAQRDLRKRSEGFIKGAF
jgi:hypothetical protein